MTNCEFAEKSRLFIERTCEKTASNLYGLMKPSFVDCDIDEMSLTMSFPAQEWELNAGGAIHGGITVSMIDSVMGSLNHILCGRLTPTIQMSVSFLRSGPAEGNIIVRARVTKLGHAVIYVTGEAWADGSPDKLIASCDGTYRNFSV